MTDREFDVAGADRVAEWINRLRAIAENVVPPFQPLEGTFLDTGSQLGVLCAAIASLAGGIEAAEGVLSGTETRDALERAVDVAARIEATRARPDDQAASSRRMVDDAEAVLKVVDSVRRTMARVKVVAINARVEASHLTRTGVDFTVFTRDIARLAVVGETTIADVAREIESLRDGARTAWEIRRDFQTRALPRLGALAEHLDQSIRSLREARARAERGARGMPDRLRTCGAAVTKIVSALQIFDTTRQRLEHVASALTRTADRLSTPDEASGGAATRLPLVNGIAELQATQMRIADESFHAAVGEVTRDMGDIAREMSALDATCRDAFGSAGTDSLSAVEEELLRGVEILGEFNDLREQAQGGIERVTATAKRAEELILGLNRISADMRLMGLNAAIKCGNMGASGQVLNVIAQELQGYAVETADSVAVAAEALKRISTAARDRAVAREDERDAPASLKSALETLEAGLRRMEVELSEALAVVSAKGGEVSSLASGVVDAFARKVDNRSRMAETRRLLEALARETETGLTGAALEEARRGALAFLEAQYTMIGERSIHDRVVENGSGGATTEAAEEVDIDGLFL